MRDLLIVSSFLVASVYCSASCGNSGIPFRFEVLPSGKPVLGCASPVCFGSGMGGMEVEHDAVFDSSPDGDDGFFRDGDLSHPRTRFPDAPSQQARCPTGFSSTSCTNPMTWVGGFEADDQGDLALQCCHYNGLKHSSEVGRPVVHSGEVYSGGEVLRDGRQTGFDAISNIRKISNRDGSVGYELTVTRMNCLPNPSEQENDVAFDVRREIGRILEKVGDTSSASGVQTNEIVSDQRLAPGNAYDDASNTYAQPPSDVPAGETEQFVQVGEQVVPVTSAGYYYPVASGVPACFTSQAKVQTSEGIKSMEELRIGDKVLTQDSGKMVYTKVTNWLHRLPETKAAFIKLETEDGKIIELTPQHFIYKSDCVGHKDLELVYAEDIKIGDCLMIQEDQEIIPKYVTSRKTLYHTGVFSPMTETGDLIVDNIYTSCHNVVKTNTLSHTFLEFASGMQRKIREIVGGFEENGHLPATAEFFMNMIDVILPNKY
ncbi:unnamed protein product [Caenorhabditis angaria]|uniref:Uncharacterized protein n=1 Tax=Caenorhabditis angaria TaxID=860376 RepID=A0A9P1IEK2_9PELO|nr:unnamed protein product [Caenorhabditis angaria]